MTQSTDTILFKHTLLELEYPLLSSDNLLAIFKFYLNQLKISLDNNIIDAIIYYHIAFQEILEFDKINEKEEQLFTLVKITDTFFTVTQKNVLFLQSTYTVVQAFMKAITHQIWQRVFKLFKNKEMQIENIDEAIKLHNDTVIDIIINAKECDIEKM